jgi:hypothetical protein
MRLLRWWTLLFCLVSRVVGGEFRTITGDVYVGEVSAADADGLIVRLQSGVFSPRVDWAKLDEATLKSLARHPRAGRFVEPLLEPPAEEIARAEARKIASAWVTENPGHEAHIFIRDDTARAVTKIEWTKP